MNFRLAGPVVCLLVVLVLGAGFAAGLLAPSAGNCRGEAWFVDASGTLHWQNRPFLPFFVPASSDYEALVQRGFKDFCLPLPQDFAELDGTQQLPLAVALGRLAETLSESGGACLLPLAGLYPSPVLASKRLLDEAPQYYVFKRLQQVEVPQDKPSITLESRLLGPGLPFPLTHLDEAQVKVFLLQQTPPRCIDVTKAIRSRRVVHPLEKPRKGFPGALFNPDGTPATAFEPAALKLELDLSALKITGPTAVFSVCTWLKTPGTCETFPGSLPALWQPALQAEFKRNLALVAPYLRDVALHGLALEAEVNTAPLSLLSAVYPDFSRDAHALAAWREWCKQRFGTVQALNAALGLQLESFDELPWQVVPWVAEQPLEGGSGRLKPAPPLYGLFPSYQALEAASRLQDEFRCFLYAKGLVECAHAAQDALGQAPLFIASAGMDGPPDTYLALQRQCLLQGFDGLARNQYGSVKKLPTGKPVLVAADGRTPFDLADLRAWLQAVQARTGRTKTLIALEIGWADSKSSGRCPFPSKQALLDFVRLLASYGYRGFGLLSRPSEQELELLAEARPALSDCLLPKATHRPRAAVAGKRWRSETSLYARACRAGLPPRRAPRQAPGQAPGREGEGRIRLRLR